MSNQQSFTRIVITGMGIVSPLGCGVELVWQRLLAGQSGLSQLPDSIVSELPAKVGGRVPSIKEDPAGGLDPDQIVTPKDQRKMDRFILLALAAAAEALAQAKWSPANEDNKPKLQHLSRQV